MKRPKRPRPVGKVDPSGMAGYPILRRYVSYESMKRSGDKEFPLYHLFKHLISNSYAIFGVKLGTRLNQDFVAMSKSRTVWYFNGADIISNLGGFKVASKYWKGLQPVVKWGTNALAKKVGTKALERAYVRVADPWRKTSGYLYYPASRVRSGNVPEY